MPRICKSNDDPMDFCRKCMPDEDEAEEDFGDVSVHGEGPDGRGNCFAYEPFHPDYGERGFAGDYHCDDCGKELTNKDN